MSGGGTQLSNKIVPLTASGKASGFDVTFGVNMLIISNEGILPAANTFDENCIKRRIMYDCAWFSVCYNLREICTRVVVFQATSMRI